MLCTLRTPSDTDQELSEPGGQAGLLPLTSEQRVSRPKARPLATRRLHGHRCGCSGGWLCGVVSAVPLLSLQTLADIRRAPGVRKRGLSEDSGVKGPPERNVWAANLLVAKDWLAGSPKAVRGQIHGTQQRHVATCGYRRCVHLPKNASGLRSDAAHYVRSRAE